MANSNRYFLAWIIPLLIFNWSTIAVASEGPWKWQFSLNIKKEKQGNQMLFPTGLYIDKDRERYYVVDAGSNGLHSFDLQGNHLNTLKPGDQLKQPYGMVRDANDVLWVVEKGRNTLTEIELKEKKIVTHNLKSKNREIYPDRIAYNDGFFYILDKISGGVVKFDKNLLAVQEISCPEGRGGFVDFALNKGFIWALDTITKTVYRFDGAGVLKNKFVIGADVSFPFALAIGPGGQIYVLDRHDGSVVVFDESGAYKYRFLSKGHSRARLYYPEDIQFDFLGRLCIVDSGNGRVEIFGR
jgi:DNA-binding beta-propeller fold protein YncE